jgi:hypothetical protein
MYAIKKAIQLGVLAVQMQNVDESNWRAPRWWSSLGTIAALDHAVDFNLGNLLHSRHARFAAGLDPIKAIMTSPRADPLREFLGRPRQLPPPIPSA